jgi:carotenoid 1,2-hydratase
MKVMQQNQTETFSFASSVKEDVWHPKTSSKAYEWWYFDALSDDGKDAIVIIFLDNFIFSPRYNKQRNSNSNPFENEINPQSAIHNPQSKVPAVAFIYYRDGKPCYRAISEYLPQDFSSNENLPECKIGESYFKFEDAPYGSGYVISINAKLSRDRHIEAHFEWLSIESDFLPEQQINLDGGHSWNMVAPRSDVTGRITVTNNKGKDLDVVHFRGTGYHDHNLDNRWLPETVKDWQWGRAHFSDSTAVFYHYQECGDVEPVTKLYVIGDGELRQRNAFFDEQTHARDKFGIKYPNRLRIDSADDIRLRVKPIKVIDSSFFYLRFLSEMTLTLRDGKPRKTIGITEHLVPKALKYRWLDWLTDMRIGKNGKGAFLP